jgi:hypothetical protein
MWKKAVLDYFSGIYIEELTKYKKLRITGVWDEI